MEARFVVQESRVLRVLHQYDLPDLAVSPGLESICLVPLARHLCAREGSLRFSRWPQFSVRVWSASEAKLCPANLFLVLL